MTLVVSQRYEEAETLVREMMRRLGDGIPEPLQRNFNFQLGMIALTRGEYPRARQLLVSAISDEDDPAYSGDGIAVVMLAALATEKVGESEEAAKLLEQAERKIKRARLNGVDDPSIYYSEAVLLTMRSEPASAMEKLREAYNRGFREQWVMEIDGRLASLRDDPAFIVLMQQIKDDVSQALMTIKSMSVAAL
jgi:uncharacterized protein HemY